MMKALDDKSLIDLCLEKDSSAWSCFVDRFSKLIYWAIKDRLKSWNYQFAVQDVEDIYQEVFTDLWEGGKLAQVKDREKIVGWLAMVAGNTAVDYFRKRKKEGPKVAISIFQNISSDENREEVTLANMLSSPEDSPERAAYLNELRQILGATIGSLPPRERAVIILSHLYGKRHREIARLLAIPVNTVSTIARRTRARLKKELNKRGIKDF